MPASFDMSEGFQKLLFAHPLKRLFDADERTGKQRFLVSYAPEGLQAQEHR